MSFIIHEQRFGTRSLLACIRKIWLIVLGAVGAGCLGTDSSAPASAPAVSGAVITPNPYNVLSALVTFRPRNADSARVLYWSAGGPKAATPYYPLSTRDATVATLGLLPATTYYHVIE